MVKDKHLQIRISEEEKTEIEQSAKKNGFDSISQFFLWLYRKFGKNMN